MSRNRRRSLEMHVKISGHGARRYVGAGFFHQMNGRRPIAVTIEEGAADAAVQDSVEGLMMRLWTPFANQLIAFSKAANAKSHLVRRTAAEAAVVRRVGFLKALAHFFANATTSGKN